MEVRRNPPPPAVLVTEQGTPAPIPGVPTSITAFPGRCATGPVGQPTLIHSFSDFAIIFGGLHPDLPLSYAVHQYFASGGSEALVLRLRRDVPEPPDGPGAPLDRRSVTEALEILAAAPDVNLLVIPRDRWDEPAPVDAGAVLNWAATHRAFWIAEAPVDEWGPVIDRASPCDGLVADFVGAAGPGARFGAIYYPDLLVPDPLRPPTVRALGPAAAVAGIYAATDHARGVWKAPAGVGASVTAATGLSRPLSDEAHGRASAAGINCLRHVPGRPPVVWGARTLRGGDHHADEYRDVNVRRLASFVEVSLQRGLQWSIFEVNDGRLWSGIAAAATAFLADLWRQGAFAGSRMSDAFVVRCDASTTTAADMQANRCNLLIGLAPLRPAEFIMLSVGLRTAEA